MFEEKNKTKQELNKIWDGLMWHCKELSGFMAEHLDDPWLNNSKLGRSMKRKALDITLAHCTGMLEMRLPEKEEEPEENEDKDDSEEKEEKKDKNNKDTGFDFMSMFGIRGL